MVKTITRITLQRYQPQVTPTANQRRKTSKDAKRTVTIKIDQEKFLHSLKLIDYSSHSTTKLDPISHSPRTICSSGEAAVSVFEKSKFCHSTTNPKAIQKGINNSGRTELIWRLLAYLNQCLSEFSPRLHSFQMAPKDRRSEKRRQTNRINCLLHASDHLPMHNDFRSF